MSNLEKLPLDSPRWAEAHHAYGVASDIPVLLRRVVQEPFFKDVMNSGEESISTALISRLCHSGSIYEASYLAVPHLVSVAVETDDEWVRSSMLYLVAGIRGSFDDRSQREVLPHERHWYEAAILVACDLAMEDLRDSNASLPEWVRVQVAAQLSGQLALGETVSVLPGSGLMLGCSKCRCEVYVVSENGALFTAGEPPHLRPATRRFPMKRGPAHESRYAAEYQWLVQHVTPEMIATLGPELLYLFGWAQCPGCHREFVFLDEFIALNARP